MVEKCNVLNNLVGTFGTQEFLNMFILQLFALRENNKGRDKRVISYVKGTV